MRRSTETARSIIAKAKRSARYWFSMASFQFGEGLRRLMADEDMQQKDLAILLERSEPWVSKVLNGKSNLTLQKMAEIAHALGGAVHVYVARQDHFVECIDLPRDHDIRLPAILQRSDSSGTMLPAAPHSDSDSPPVAIPGGMGSTVTSFAVLDRAIAGTPLVN